MSLKTTTTICIENKIQENTGKPYGEKYAGVFSIKRPSIQDKRQIAIKNAASLSAHGEITQDVMPDALNMLGYIFIFMQHIATEPLPKWFNEAELYDEDVDAVYAVFAEVNEWLDSFRPKNDSGTGE